MKKIKYAWIEQVLEFDSVEEASDYTAKLKSGRPQKFKIMEEAIIEGGKVSVRIRKQYNKNDFPDD